MSTPTTQAQNVWPSTGGQDYLHLQANSGGGVIGGINSSGSPFGSMASVSSPILKATVLVTSAQLLALTNSNTSGPTLLPAPGAGLVNDLISIAWNYNFKTTAYTITAGTELEVFFSGNAFGLAEVTAAGLLDQTHSAVIPSIGTTVGFTGSPNYALSAAANVALLLGCNKASAPLTLGDGTLTLTMLYQLLAVS